MSNAWILGRGFWNNNNRPIKDSVQPSNRNPLRIPFNKFVSKNIVLLVSGNHLLMKLGKNGFIIQPTNFETFRGDPTRNRLCYGHYRFKLQVLPDHLSPMTYLFECFSYFEPVDLHTVITWSERPPSGKGAFIRSPRSNMPNLNCTVWCIKLETTWCSNLDRLTIYWLKRCWTGVIGKNGPDSVFRARRVS
ncbi:hypothetical protein TNIN_393001 [Trichonephila inaurata madagascariensis]|uniref:Uncharacterized protein n=1 Tax=Trichonephila inaurata madagascariensis TaxID=2747483 RepID=A0A8X6X3V0_9ARAC|nr:hypothetical protein TNIN_393001 [Trichonephila inaurata madagascariensis]